jgi:hypothetical protein
MPSTTNLNGERSWTPQEKMTRVDAGTCQTTSFMEEDDDDDDDGCDGYDGVLELKSSWDAASSGDCFQTFRIKLLTSASKVIN